MRIGSRRRRGSHADHTGGGIVGKKAEVRCIQLLAAASSNPCLLPSSSRCFSRFRKEEDETSFCPILNCVSCFKWQSLLVACVFIHWFVHLVRERVITNNFSGLLISLFYCIQA